MSTQSKARALLQYTAMLAAVGCATDFSEDFNPEAEEDVAVTTMKLSTPQCTEEGQDDGPFGNIIVPVASNGSTDCWLDRGSHNAAVGALQMALNACWYQSLEEDDDYGPLTQQAVRTIQDWLNIPADGVYGPQTKAHMDKGFAGALFGECGTYR